MSTIIYDANYPTSPPYSPKTCHVSYLKFQKAVWLIGNESFRQRSDILIQRRVRFVSSKRICTNGRQICTEKKSLFICQRYIKFHSPRFTQRRTTWVWFGLVRTRLRNKVHTYSFIYLDYKAYYLSQRIP